MNASNHSRFATLSRMFAFVAASILVSLTFDSLASATLVDAFNGPPSGGDLRTDAFPQAGYGFYATTAGTKQVNELGYWVAPAVTGGPGVLAVSHEVALYQYNGTNYTVIAEGTVPAGSVADANGYAWVSVPTVTLTNNGQQADYYLVEAAQGVDTWTPNTGSISHPVLDSSFGTLTGHGAFISAPIPGVGGSVGSAVLPWNFLANGGYVGGNIGFVATPEPSSCVLCGLGAAGLLLATRRRRKA